MTETNLTLELLVKKGNPDGVEELAKMDGLDEGLKQDKMTEAGIYSAINFMWSGECAVGIDTEVVCPHLTQDRITEYLSRTTNVTLLSDLIDVLQVRTRVEMEAYAQILPFQVFGLEPVAEAIKRNIDAPGIRKKVTELATKGYGLVFCPYEAEIDAEMVEHYFPLIDQWREFVDPYTAVQEAIKGFKDIEGIFEEDYEYNKDFVYVALDKLIEMTDRETVSRLMYNEFKGSDDYERFVTDGKIDKISKKKKSRKGVKPEVAAAIADYEGESYPSKYSVNRLAKAIGKSGTKDLGKKLGEWFTEGKMWHLQYLINDETRLYDVDEARKALAAPIMDACQKRDWAKLSYVMDFPQDLIDESNPGLVDVVKAYKIHQDTKAQV